MAKNDTGDTSALDNILQCQICHNKLNTPLTLKQCLHFFCKSCLEAVPKKTLDEKEGWFCPQCNSFSGEDEIDADFFVASLLDAKNNKVPEASNKAVVCEQCGGDSEVSAKCTDCKIALCEKCKSLHLKIPLLKSHKIVPLDLEGGDVIDDVMFCPLHQDRVCELNCKFCGKVICLVCKATDHETHQTEFIATALDGIDTNTTQIFENIEAIKKQIEFVKFKIEQIKDTYASCRLAMDDHLEKVISRLRSMKAQVEDDVTEQESVALDTLDSIKRNLENQLSKATNLVNLVSAARECYMNASLVTTMYGGLYAKVNHLGQQKQLIIDVKIPEVTFTESVNIENTFVEVFGDVQYDVESSVIDPSGQILEYHNMCRSFVDFFSNTFIENKTINLPSSSNRLSYIDGQIWVPMKNKNLIYIYNQQGELIKSVDTEQRVTVVKEAHNGDIIAGGDDGLYLVSRDWSEWSHISEGKFSDIILHKYIFSALDYSSKKILTFSYSKFNNLWREKRNITVTADVMHSNFQNTISSCGDTFLVSDIIGKKIMQYNKVGDLINSKSFQSELCFAGIDKSGKVLSTNFIEGTLHLLDINSDELSLPSIGDIKCHQLRDVIIDGEQNVWCLQGNKSKFTVVKFVMKT